MGQNNHPNLLRFTANYRNFKAGETFTIPTLMKYYKHEKTDGEVYEMIGQLLQSEILVRTSYNPTAMKDLIQTAAWGIDPETREWIRNNCTKEEGSEILLIRHEDLPEDTRRELEEMDDFRGFDDMTGES